MEPESLPRVVLRHGPRFSELPSRLVRAYALDRAKRSATGSGVPSLRRHNRRDGLVPKIRSSCARQTALSRLSPSRLSPSLFLAGRPLLLGGQVVLRAGQVASGKQKRDGGHRRHHEQFGLVRSLHLCIPTLSGCRAAVSRPSGPAFRAHPVSSLAIPVPDRPCAPAISLRVHRDGWRAPTEAAGALHP